jgi:hypothetical protein
VVYDFSSSCAGEYARNFLGTWNGKLVCDDFAGYKAGFELGITEIGCMAHARRNFSDLHMAMRSRRFIRLAVSTTSSNMPKK